MSNHYVSGENHIMNCKFLSNIALIGAGFNNGSGGCVDIIEDCEFSENSCKDSLEDTGAGGAIYDTDSIVGSGKITIIKNCIFTRNNASGGGAIRIQWLSPIITNCIFCQNSATSGGAVFNYQSNPEFNNCLFYKNIASPGHGGVIHQFYSSPTFNNCTFSNNVADKNGGVMNNGSYVYSEIVNCVFWGNSAGENGDEIYNSEETSMPTISYSDIEGSGGSDNWDPNLGTDGGGNIDEDPLFVDPDNDDYHIETDSPCVNAGDPNGDYSGQTDMDGDPRVVDLIVDIGADEIEGRVYNLNRDEWYATIQNAIDYAYNGDELVAYPDTYYESVDFDGKAVKVRSTDPNDWEVVEATIIDSEGSSQTVLFNSSEGSNSVLSGFTVTGGTYGIKCTTSGPTISKCIITDNSSHGVYCEGYYASQNPQPEIKNCKIYQNTGDGIYFNANKGPNVRDCWIYDNYNGIKISGYPMYAYQILNNTIVYNTNKGIWRSGGSYVIKNCIVWGNGDDLYNCSATYSFIGEQRPGEDPLFVNDYHLQPDSPCIDAGDPNGDYSGQVDIDGDIRTVDCDYDGLIEVDMGADEAVYSPPIWDYLTQCHGDCSGSGDVPDGRVDVSDLLKFRIYEDTVYGDGSYNPAPDFDRDGDVDDDDYDILVANWCQTVPSDCNSGGTWPQE